MRLSEDGLFPLTRCKLHHLPGEGCLGVQRTTCLRLAMLAIAGFPLDHHEGTRHHSPFNLVATTAQRQKLSFPRRFIIVLAKRNKNLRLTLLDVDLWCWRGDVFRAGHPGLEPIKGTCLLQSFIPHSRPFPAESLLALLETFHEILRAVISTFEFHCIH